MNTQHQCKQHWLVIPPMVDVNIVDIKDMLTLKRIKIIFYCTYAYKFAVLGRAKPQVLS